MAFQGGPFTGVYQGQGGSYNYVVWDPPTTHDVRFRIFNSDTGSWDGRAAVFGYLIAVWA